MGFSRSPHSDDQFRKMMWQGVREIGEMAVRQDEWAMFAQSMFYVGATLANLRQRLTQ